MRRRLKPILFYLPVLFLIGGLIVASYRNNVALERQTKEIVTIAENDNKDQKMTVIEDLLTTMTLEEKVGQLFWSRVPYDNPLEHIHSYHLGGYLLFGKDFDGQSLESIQALIDSYQSASKIPLLIGSDEEGGTVTRISSILSEPFQSPMTLYQNGGLTAVISDTKTKADILKFVGINAGLFPIVDVATDPAAFIYDRTIGEDAKTTAEYVTSVIQELKMMKLGSTLKHFPGYGNNGDSHMDIITDERDLETLRDSDFLPFKAGIAAGADSILVSHNILSDVDNIPSSISPKINQILRKELQFNGVIMTDDLDMAGLAQLVDQDEAAYQVILAGNDVILGSSHQTQIPYLLEKVTSGELTEERINDSVRRILSWKYDLGLLSATE